MKFVRAKRHCKFTLGKVSCHGTQQRNESEKKQREIWREDGPYTDTAPLNFILRAARQSIRLGPRSAPRCPSGLSRVRYYEPCVLLTKSYKLQTSKLGTSIHLVSYWPRATNYKQASEAHPFLYWWNAAKKWILSLYLVGSFITNCIIIFWGMLNISKLTFSKRTKFFVKENEESFTIIGEYSILGTKMGIFKINWLI